MPAHTMTIDGKSVQGSKTVGVVNPATGKVFAEVPDCSKAELDQAMNAAQKAFPAWSRDVNARRKVLQECAAALQQTPEGLARTLTQEQGKPLDKAGQEIMGTSMWCAYTAMLDLPNEVLQDTPQAKIEIKRKPLGVVAAITPWNYPIMLAMWKIAPALLAGNTVVIKPSPYTPITTLMLGEILRDIVPPGVLNVVSGGDELGAWMTSHPVPRKISFTGSVETGKKVAASAAPDLKRVTLELGGNDAAIILNDVDPKAVAPKIFWGAMENSGQICSAIKRVYGPEETFKVGGSKVVKQSAQDRVAVIGAGITLHESLSAYDQLKGAGINVRIIDAYSVKPIDRETLHRAARDTGGKLVVVEDHWIEGGLGDAVLDAFAGAGAKPPTVVKLAVTQMPGSGTPAELLHAAGIDADAIVKAVKSLL